MLRIAVCDDRKESADELCCYVKEYFQAACIESEIVDFFSGRELLKELENEHFDVYFLDIFMPELNGMEIGQMIRKTDQKAVIVYITVSREYAFEAFGVRAFQYLQKPVMKKELFDVLDGIVNFLGKKSDRKICVRTRDGLVNVNMADILYVENVSRCPVYMLKDGEQVVSVCNRGSFEKSVSFLNRHSGFVQPHKSYFVNMHFIHTLGPKSLTLDDGTQIAVSRKRFVETKRVYLEFLADEGEII